MEPHQQRWIAGYLDAAAVAYDTTGNDRMARDLADNLCYSAEQLSTVPMSDEAREFVENFIGPLSAP